MRVSIHGNNILTMVNLSIVMLIRKSQKSLFVPWMSFPSTIGAKMSTKMLSSECVSTGKVKNTLTVGRIELTTLMLLASRLQSELHSSSTSIACGLLYLSAECHKHNLFITIQHRTILILTMIYDMMMLYTW